MEVALGLFVLAALGGLALAALRLQNKPLPVPLAAIHGLAAAVGLVVLAVAALGGGAPSLATTALVVLVIAALGGFLLVSFHFRQKPLPVPLMVIHALAAVAGVALLLVALLGS